MLWIKSVPERAFRTHVARLAMLRNISSYGWPADYVRQHEAVVRDMTVERIRVFARQYADPGLMHYLIVGDADTQPERSGELGIACIALNTHRDIEAPLPLFPLFYKLSP